jgi:hypothetical protein
VTSEQNSDLYGVFGLRLRSEIPLPELFPASGPNEPDVTIRFGRVEGEYAITPEAIRLVIPKVASYLITGGREIVIDPVPDCSERNIRLFLLGSALGGILHQRGLLPLHANAIEIEGRAVAFMGHSGAGKSTMAAWFLDRGYRVLADDVCVVTLDEAGQPLAHRGIPRLRLWREAIEISGRTVQDYELSFDDMDKYNVPTPRPEDTRPVPLHHLYLLRKAEEGTPGVQRLQGIEAVDALVANTYRGGYVGRIGATRRHLEACLALVRKVPVFAATRTWGFADFDAQAAALEAHAREQIAEAGVAIPRRA